MESLCAQLLLVITIMFSPSLAVGLSFGSSTHVTDYAAFQRPGTVMEAFCAAPDGFNSSMLYFTLGSMDREFSAAETPQYVSVIDHVTVKFMWQFAKSNIDDTVNIYCRVRGEVNQSWMERNLPFSWLEKRLYAIFINNGPSLTMQPLSCTVNVKWVSSAGGQVTVTCNLTRSNHTEKFTSVRYSVFEGNGTSIDSQETLLWSMTDSDPKNGSPPPVTFSFTRDSSTITAIDNILFKVVLFESFSGDTVSTFQTLHVLDALNLPANTLEWVPFSDGTGFAVSLHNGLISRRCKQQQWYMATINVTDAGDDEQSMLTSHHSSVTLLCNPCSGSGDCAVVIAGLTPAQTYSVTLQQLMFDNATASLKALSLPGLLLQQQPTSSFQVLTEEHVPLTGPEIYQFYQVFDCDTSAGSCGSCSQAAAAAAGGSCQLIRIFWKGMTRRQANGQLRFYQVLVSREPDDEKETLNFTAEVRTAEVLRHSSQELHISVAGGTGKGLPAQVNWSTCIIPREEPGRTALQGTMLSRESANTGPCNVSWFLKPSLIGETSTATLLYCSSKADKCHDYSVVTMRPWLTDNAGWQPLQRFVWSSSQIGDASHHMCRDGTLAVAVASSPEERSARTTSMSRLLEVDCRFLRQNDARPTPPKITSTYSDYHSVCIKWLPFPRSCGAAQGLPVSLNISLRSSDRSRLLEQQHMDGDATSYCFTENIAEAETYYASLMWTTDIGLPLPLYVSSDEVRLRTPGLTVAAKSGVILGGVVSGVLMVVGLIGCVRKARVYRNTWRGNLKIPKIRIAAASNCQDTSLLDSVSFLQQTISSEKNQKSSYPRFTQTPEDLQANRLRKWSSKDSAFASQDGSMPTACNERLAYGDARLLSDCQQQDSECSADVAGLVYTTFGRLTHADFIASPSGEFISSQTANEIQTCRPLIGDEDSTVAYLPNEASLLMSVLTSDHPRCCNNGSSVQLQLPDDCTSPSMLVDTCNLSKQHGMHDPDATVIVTIPIHEHRSRWSSDTTVGAEDSSSCAYAAEVTSSSAPSDYIRVTDEESRPTLPAAGFRCSACFDDIAPLTTDYISISDALKQADA